MKYKILDCTLRDGGYYNNWLFSKKLAQDYLYAMSKSGIKYVELGFRSPVKNVYKGQNWYTSEEYLNKLSIPKNLSAEINSKSWQMPSIFDWLKNEGNILQQDMYRIFNCGIGLVLIVNEEDVDSISKEIKSNNFNSFVIGKVIEKNQKESVIFK